MKTYLIALLLVITTTIIHGQALESSAYGGYMFSGKAKFYDGEIDVKNGPVWGLTLGYDTGLGTQIQFLYNNTFTVTETIEYGSNINYHKFDLMIQHFHLGVEKSMAYDQLIRPFGSFGMGLTSYNPQSNEFNNQMRFSIGLGGGIKIFPTDRIGFKAQAKLFMPLLFNGAGIYCGTGGCGGGSSFRIPIIHAELSGGVVFRLEKDE
ncbi:porin family protein [Reichenbachiella ulvae]|uniref:Porin family protein n=1 Tax=Reichenbachiella ulvae TaxID=2980104 RepID=A0ABT3CXY8_9BACT|nr:porin family protein [Reichenbachiella ulvae]MCV9388399.1 porin family protein [Reichenbachiella ulvae]